MSSDKASRSTPYGMPIQAERSRVQASAKGLAPQKRGPSERRTDQGWPIRLRDWVRIWANQNWLRRVPVYSSGDVANRQPGRAEGIG